MSWIKGAYSRHVARKNLKRQRVKRFGSRRNYRRNKRAMGGKGGSW